MNLLSKTCEVHKGFDSVNFRKELLIDHHEYYVQVKA